MLPQAKLLIILVPRSNPLFTIRTHTHIIIISINHYRLASPLLIAYLVFISDLSEFIDATAIDWVDPPLIQHDEEDDVIYVCLYAGSKGESVDDEG